MFIFKKYPALVSSLFFLSVLFLSLFFLKIPALAQTGEQSLSENVENLKAEVLKLNRDLFILEEDLLYPASTAVTLYVSLDKGDYFHPSSVEVSIDEKRVTSHLYTEREVAALQRGGIQKVHQGNVKSGEHNLVAVFVGQGPEGREYRRAVRHTFAHDGSGLSLELQISDDHKKQQPSFTVKEWTNE